VTAGRRVGRRRSGAPPESPDAGGDAGVVPVRDILFVPGRSYVTEPISMHTTYYLFILQLDSDIFGTINPAFKLVTLVTSGYYPNPNQPIKREARHTESSRSIFRRHFRRRIDRTVTCCPFFQLGNNWTHRTFQRLFARVSVCRPGHTAASDAIDELTRPIGINCTISQP
jgi:hypothetical protein